MTIAATGPLSGIRIVEIAGLGPGPFCAQLFADLGADVICVERPDGGSPLRSPISVEQRNKRSIAINLKSPEGIALLLSLIQRADGLIEGFRPGVAERLGVGPDVCLGLNPKLVFGRMTGWGQAGPLAHCAGHDINYIGLTGALQAMGPRNTPPLPPLNLVGDYGGGALFLAFGMVCALLEAKKSGMGQVVDAAIIDGTNALMGIVQTLHHANRWSTEREANLLDGAAPFYRTYETADRKFIAVGAIEPAFFAALLEGLALNAAEFGAQWDRTAWTRQSARLADTFRMKSRDEWAQIFEGSDACVTPVLDYREAPRHCHQIAREGFITVAGMEQPAPAPRFSRTPGAVRWGAPQTGGHSVQILAELSIPDAEIERLLSSGVVASVSDKRVSDK
ncbi:CaiB/BaiF CoA transferase family protein [Burkholderia sp. MSMB1835]|uniref:CaiB/BaiF CoA transferase family protein n=1 Tax=Burkholderia sp. MSMB1835 TaxID=1637876 RepID=UPI00075E7336|nr:CaiB/BaiF CoA-transferase family protein [Burkholderia sp. MSMB1835]KVL37242.1 carnitine dehydratase [Burkholderia sp. MSMB1835]